MKLATTLLGWLASALVLAGIVLLALVPGCGGTGAIGGGTPTACDLAHAQALQLPILAIAVGGAVIVGLVINVAAKADQRQAD